MQVTDPVWGKTIESDQAKAKESWHGQTYYLSPNRVTRNFRQPRSNMLLRRTRRKKDTKDTVAE